MGVEAPSRDLEELATSDQFPVPCTISAIGAAGSGGALGFVFGFGAPGTSSILTSEHFKCVAHKLLRPDINISGLQNFSAGQQLLKHRGKGRLKACRKEGFAGAKVKLAATPSRFFRQLQA